jgi:hypothetical protein
MAQNANQETSAMAIVNLIVPMEQEEVELLAAGQWGKSMTSTREGMTPGRYYDAEGRSVSSLESLALFESRARPSTEFLHMCSFASTFTAIGEINALNGYAVIVGSAKQFYPYNVDGEWSFRYDNPIHAFVHIPKWRHMSFMDTLPVSNFDPRLVTYALHAFKFMTGPNDSAAGIADALCVLWDALITLMKSGDSSVDPLGTRDIAWEGYSTNMSSFCYLNCGTASEPDYALVDWQEHNEECNELVGCAHGRGLDAFSAAAGLPVLINDPEFCEGISDSE